MTEAPLTRIRMGMVHRKAGAGDHRNTHGAIVSLWLKNESRTPLMWDNSTKCKTGGQQASSHVVVCPPTAPEVWREHDALPAEEGCWLEGEVQEWARLCAGRGQHLIDAEQPSQACSTAKELAEEWLAVLWHSLPTLYLLELAACSWCK